MLQNPFRNSSIIGVNVYSHSGEFSPQFFDLTIPGRGLSFQFVRKYRSSNSAENNILGRGWDFNYGKWLESNDEDNNIIIYHDGFGRNHQFDKLAGTNIYRSPNGIYSTLSQEGDDSSKMLLKERFGTLFLFEKPAKINHNVKNNNHDGFSNHTQGRLLSIKDRNGNTIEFKYNNNVIRAIDSLGREITMTLDNNDRIIKLQDHANRIWYYNYNQDECLVETVQPTTREFPEGPRIKYAYDKQNRLKSITDPNGQTFLENYYDEEGRVSKQNYGEGYFEFKYDKIGNTENGFPIYNTRVRLKNESNIILMHNEQGLVIEHTSFVSSSSLHPEDLTKISLYSDSTSNNKIKQKDTLIPPVTKSKFNKNNEVIERTFPAGNSTKRIYDENSDDPLSRANLLQIIRAPSKEGKINEHEELAVFYSYEPRHNFVESFTNSLGFKYLYKYDDRGNRVQNIFPKVTTTINDIKKESNRSSQTKSLIKISTLVSSCTYNDAGQIISYIDTSGSTTDYYYYPADDPCGIVDSNKMIQEGKGGYLAKIVRNPVKEDQQLKDKPANLVKTFGYDIHGNRIIINDGKSIPTQI